MPNSREHQTGPTLIDLLRQRAAEQPEHQVYTFLTDGEQAEVSLTHEELDRRARSVAAALQELGAIGERVILFCPPGLDYVAAFFGCLYAGAVAVPAFPPRANRPTPRLEAIVVDAQVAVALATKAVLANLSGKSPQAAPLDKLRWLAVDDLPPGLDTRWRQTRPAPDQLAILQYTSGSTNTPRGVMLSHNNVMYNLASIRQELNISSQDTGVSWLPAYHDMGLIGGIVEPLFVGGRALLMSPAAFLQRPLRWLQAVSHYRGTIATGPNFAYELCINRITPEQREELDLSSWRIALCGAEPIRTETLNRFAATFESCGFSKGAFHPCYGLAEATLFVSGAKTEAQPITLTVRRNALGDGRVVKAPVEDTATQTLVGSGRVTADQEVIIVDPESLTPCAPGEVGEVWVSGPNVGQGYWNRPEETERTFRAYTSNSGTGPFLRTGDLGFLHRRELFVTGRHKDLIVIRGQNFYPQDIELTADRSHTALRPGAGAAFAIDVDNEERLVVVQELDRNARHVDMDAVVTAICEAVAAEHELLPYAVVLLKVGSIPTTSSGKVQRYACREQFLAGTLNAVKEWRQKLNDKQPQAYPGRQPVEVQVGSESAPTAPSEPQQRGQGGPRSAQGAGELYQSKTVSETSVHPLLGWRLRSAQIIFESELSAHSPSYLNDHRVQGTAILPAAAYVEMALAAARQALGPGPHSLGELDLQKALFLPERGTRTVQVVLSTHAPGEEHFQLYSCPGDTGQAQEQWTLHATGKIQHDLVEASFPVPWATAEEIQARCTEQISGRNFYFKLHDRGFQYGRAFQEIGWLWRRDGEALAQLQVPQTLEMEGYQIHPAILESSFQVLAATLPLRTAPGSGLYLPVGIARARIYGRPTGHLWGHARLQSGIEHNSKLVEGDVRLLDESGSTLVEVMGLRLQRLSADVQPSTGGASGLTREVLFAVEPERRLRFLEMYLQSELARVLDIDPSYLTPHLPLRTIGLDSLLAVELKSRVEVSLDVRLHMMSLFEDPTISLLANQLLRLATEAPAERARKHGIGPEYRPVEDPEQEMSL